MAGPVLPCVEEANVNGDANGAVDISDLTTIVSHLFITFVELGSC
jgi:hypothetical protein